MRKQVLFSLMLTFGFTGGLTVCPVTASAAVTQQTIKVKGQVVDQDGEPLIGATVRVKGASSGSVTDIDGNFQIVLRLILSRWRLTLTCSIKW